MVKCRFSFVVPLLISVLSLAVLGGCKTTGLSVPSFFNLKPKLSNHLERGYRMLAEYENYLQEDEQTAYYFHNKAEMAGRGEVVEPGEVKENTDLNAAEELKKSRLALTRALANQETGSDDIKLAEAQLNFDCWLMRAAQRQETAHLCRQAFYQVMETLDLTNPDPIRVFSVYFEVGKATPNAEALSLIKQAAYAHALHEDWPVFLNGYSDPTGDKQSNRILSMRRALAVRNALAQYGVDPDKVSIDAFGEEKLKQGDSPEQARRVDVVIEPESANHKAGTSHIEDIAGHYFD